LDDEARSHAQAYAATETALAQTRERLARTEQELEAARGAAADATADLVGLRSRGC